MSSDARHNFEEQGDVTPPHADDYIAPAPRVSVQAFCEIAFIGLPWPKKIAGVSSVMITAS